MLVGVLKGAFLFMADLCRHLKAPLRCDFVRASSFDLEGRLRNLPCVGVVE